MKKGNKFKITKSQLAQIIKEEYASMSKDNARAGEIKARLARINKELGGLPQTLSEVEASGTKKVSATGWTGAGKNDVKYGEKFEKIGSHLKEEDELDTEMDSEAGYFEMKFAELGRDIDGKIDGGDVEDEIEVELDDEMDVDMGDMDSEEEEIETIEMDVDDEDEDEDEVEDEEEVEEINEDLNEPIEGETPAQDSDARFNDYMEKDRHVNENAKYGSKVLSEGFTSAKKTALSSELERMRNLAKIGR